MMSLLGTSRAGPPLQVNWGEKRIRASIKNYTCRALPFVYYVVRSATLCRYLWQAIGHDLHIQFETTIGYIWNACDRTAKTPFLERRSNTLVFFIQSS